MQRKWSRITFTPNRRRLISFARDTPSVPLHAASVIVLELRRPLFYGREDL